MPTIASNRKHVAEHFYQKVDLHKGLALLPSSVPFFWDPWGTTRADETYVIHRFTARLLAGNRDLLRCAASDMVVQIRVFDAVAWSRNLEYVVQTPLAEELETRIHRMELILNWLMQEETRASRTLQRLGAQPLKGMPPIVGPPGRLPHTVLVPPRQNFSVCIKVERPVEIAEDVTISFELHVIHSYEHIT